MCAPVFQEMGSECVCVCVCVCVFVFACVSWLPLLLLQSSDNVNESTVTTKGDKELGGWKGILPVFLKILCCARFVFCENDERAVSQQSPKTPNISPTCTSVTLSVLSQFTNTRPAARQNQRWLFKNPRSCSSMTFLKLHWKRFSISYSL